MNAYADPTMPSLVDPGGPQGGFIPPPAGAAWGGQPTGPAWGNQAAGPSHNPYPVVPPPQQAAGYHYPYPQGGGAPPPPPQGTPWQNMAHMSPTLGGGQPFVPAAQAGWGPTAAPGWPGAQDVRFEPPPDNTAPLRPAHHYSPYRPPDPGFPSVDANGFGSGSAWRPPQRYYEPGMDASDQPVGGGGNWFAAAAGGGAGGSRSNPATPMMNNGWEWGAEQQAQPTFVPNTPAGAGHVNPGWGGGGTPGWGWGAQEDFGPTPGDLHRSNTQTLGRHAKQSPRHRPRANSFGGTVSTPLQWPSGLHASGYPTQRPVEQYGPGQLAMRPRDWRADYNPRPGLLSMMSVISKHRSDVREINDPVKRRIHPLLAYTGSAEPSIVWWLHIDWSIPDAIKFPYLHRRYNDLDFAQLATQPPTTHMRLYHARLPWYIDVVQSHPNGVTIMDVLRQTYYELAGRGGQINARHYWNEELGEEERYALRMAYMRRCATVEHEKHRGIKKLDFLGMEGRVIFVGLVRGRNGMYEMKLKRAP